MIFEYSSTDYGLVRITVGTDWNSGPALVTWTEEGVYKEWIIPAALLRILAKGLGRELFQENLDRFLSILEKEDN